MASTLTLDEAVATLRKQGVGGLRKAIGRHLGAWALIAERASKDNASSFLEVRTGRLRSSIRGTADKDALVGILSAGERNKAEVKYARVQEKGGTIVPTRGQFLAVPTALAKTAAGVSRFASPRDVPGLVFHRSKKGGLMLGEWILTGRGKSKKPTFEPWFWLVRSVYLRPRRYLLAGFVTAEVELRERIANDARGMILGGN